MKLLMWLRILLVLMAGAGFLISIGAHIYVKLRMRPDADLDEYYFEFEDHHPGYARYQKWSQRTFMAAIVCALILFVAGFVL